MYSSEAKLERRADSSALQCLNDGEPNALGVCFNPMSLGHDNSEDASVPIELSSTTGDLDDVLRIIGNTGCPEPRRVECGVDV
jgi:hypothetical protein